MQQTEKPALPPSAFDMIYPSQSRGVQCPVPCATADAAGCHCCASVCRVAIRTAMLLRDVGGVLAMGSVLVVSRVAHVSKNYERGLRTDMKALLG